MGCGGSGLSAEEAELKRQSDQIDRTLHAEREKYKLTIKVLLLGAGESGKSTFLKQMRIIHGEDFKESDCLEFRPTIYTNIMKAGKVLIQARELLNIQWGDEANSRHADLIAAAPPGVEQYTEIAPYFAALEELWLDSGIQETYSKRSLYHIVSLTAAAYRYAGDMFAWQKLCLALKYVSLHAVSFAYTCIVSMLRLVVTCTNV